MTLVLPRLSDMISAEEYTLTVEQELRLLDDRQRRGRWFIAPAGTRAPGPKIERKQDGHPHLAEPWLDPWLQLNDPAEDDMVGVCVLDQDDSAHGILIWVHPTPEAEAAWRAAALAAANDWKAAISLGCETGIRVDPDYRAVFRSARPLEPVYSFRKTDGPGLSSVRWRFDRPPGEPAAWDVMTAGWTPRGYIDAKPEIEQ